MQKENGKRYTVAGTDIEEVKRKNAESGLSYNEVFELMAKKSVKDFQDNNEQKNNLN